MSDGITDGYKAARQEEDALLRTIDTKRLERELARRRLLEKKERVTRLEAELTQLKAEIEVLKKENNLY